MEYGLTYFPTDRSMPPGDFARAAEARGFGSVWFAEHSHMPVSPFTPGPPEAGEPGLPREYYALADPFVALSLAAAATATLKLGTGVCLLAQRDVFQTAKQVASLDLYSGGRLLFGVGGGWNQPETEDHGTSHARRFAVLREKVEAMKALWTEEIAEYHGKHVDFGPCRAWPKPVQSPHPPVHVGGAGERAIRRAVRYGDGWIPLMSEGEDEPLGLLPRLHEALCEAGRDVYTFEVSIYFCPPAANVVERCLDERVTRVLFPAPSADESTVLSTLDTYTKLIQ